MSDIQHNIGTFKKFRVLKSIHLGSVGVNLPEGTIFEFDGQELVWGTNRFTIPAFVGAINSRWAVPVEDNVSQYIPQSSGIEMRPATSMGSERGDIIDVEISVTEEDKFLGTVEENNDRRKAANNPNSSTGPTKPAVKASPSDPKGPKKFESKLLVDTDQEAAEISFSDSKGPAKFTSEVITDQDTVPVSTINRESGASVGGKSSGKRTILENTSQADNAIRQTNAVKPIRTQKVAAPSKKPAAKTVAWDRSGKPKDRAAKAIEQFGNDPAALKQVKRQETKQVQNLIRAAMKEK